MLLSIMAYKSKENVTSLHLSFEATSSINLSTLNISLSNLFKYFIMDSPPDWVTPKSYVTLLLTGILVLNLDTSLAQRSLKSMIEPSSMLLYQACADPLKVVRRILYIISPSYMTNSRLLCMFWTRSHGSVRPSQLSKVIFLEMYFIEMRVCKTHLDKGNPFILWWS
jgi:hypothetical protein